jgi:Asp-tRNA(Asn)/Glu-tRNA(Gln) amidotransferase A subunit family amidase
LLFSLTPGGSSGGESALLACGGSVLGIGTDIGGSVRIPAHFSGNTALKPTARRFSLAGFRPSVPGQEAIPAVAGPMAQRVDDLIMLLREVWVKEAWERDSDLIPLPFDEKEINNTQQKLRFGYYIDDGFVAASPACSRAVLETVEALRKDGHTVTEFKPPRLVFHFKHKAE